MKTIAVLEVVNEGTRLFMDNENVRLYFESQSWGADFLTAYTIISTGVDITSITTGGILALRSHADDVRHVLKSNNVRIEDLMKYDEIVTQTIFTSKQIENYVLFATKQNNKNRVMLGLWDGGSSNSYISKAGKEYTYFDFGDKWDEVYTLIRKNDNEIWRINKQYIDEQKALGKDFYFSHDPFSPKDHQFFAREVNYLIDLGVKDFVKIDDLWKAIW